MKRIALFVTVSFWFIGVVVWAAETVPVAVHLPGTQPGEVGSLESPNKCDNCHGGYDQAVPWDPLHHVSFTNRAIF